MKPAAGGIICLLAMLFTLAAAGCTTEVVDEERPLKPLKELDDAFYKEISRLCGPVERSFEPAKTNSGQPVKSNQVDRVVKPARLLYTSQLCSGAVFSGFNPQILEMVHPWMRKLQLNLDRRRVVYADIHPRSCLVMSLYFVSKRGSFALTYHDRRDDEKPAPGSAAESGACSTTDYQRHKVNLKRDFLDLATTWTKIIIQ